MTVTVIIVMLLIGFVVGSLGRLVVPGSPPVPLWLTTVIGAAAALAGTLFTIAIGVSTYTAGIDWRGLAIQSACAGIGVVVAANMYTRRGRRFDSSPVYGRAAPRRHTPSTSPPSSTEPGASTASRRDTAVTTPRAHDFADSRRRASPEDVARPDSEPRVAPSVPRTPSTPHRIFVSYRRMDSQYAAGRIADHLRKRFGRVEIFMDVIPSPPASTSPRADELPRELAALPRLTAIRLEHESWEADVGVLIKAVESLRSRQN